MKLIPRTHEKVIFFAETLIVVGTVVRNLEARRAADIWADNLNLTERSVLQFTVEKHAGSAYHELRR